MLQKKERNLENYKFSTFTLLAGYWTRFGHETLSVMFAQKEERLLVFAD